MVIVCPDCTASYRVEPGALGVGRTVRCTRCGTSWFAEGAAAGAAPEIEAPAAVVQEPEAGLEPAMLDAVVEPPRKDERAARRRRLPRLFGRAHKSARTADFATTPRKARPARRQVRPVALLAAVGVALLAAAIPGRVDVVRYVPSLASLYAAAGLHVNVRGLSIEGLRSVEEIEAGVPILLVTGVVANISSASVDVPRLRLAVTAPDGRELYSWTTLPTRARLPPGERVSFRARLASPPAEGREIAARFLARQDLAAHTR